MVASLFLSCFLCGPGALDDVPPAKPNVEQEPKAPSAAEQGEVLLASMRAPLLALEGGWFERVQMVLGILRDRARLQATLIGITRNDVSGDPAFCVLAGAGLPKPSEGSDPSYAGQCTEKDKALVIHSVCSTLKSVPCTPDCAAACIPLIHGGAAAGVLWLTVDTSLDDLPPKTAPTLVDSSPASQHTLPTPTPTLTTSSAAAAALLSSTPSLDSLAFTVSMALLSADPQQLPWLSAAVHRISVAASLHALTGELREALAAHVHRRFVLEATVRAVLVAGGEAPMGHLIEPSHQPASGTGSRGPKHAGSGNCNSNSNNNNGNGDGTSSQVDFQTAAAVVLAEATGGGDGVAAADVQLPPGGSSLAPHSPSLLRRGTRRRLSLLAMGVAPAPIIPPAKNGAVECSIGGRGAGPTPVPAAAPGTSPTPQLDGSAPPLLPSPGPLAAQLPGSFISSQRPRSIRTFVTVDLAVAGPLDTPTGRTLSGSTTRSIVVPLPLGDLNRQTDNINNSWQCGLLTPNAATMHAHSFPLQHTLLQRCANGGGGGGAAAAIQAAVVEDCCSLLQDVHRPCRDVCLLMGMFQHQQQHQQHHTGNCTQNRILGNMNNTGRTLTAAFSHLVPKNGSLGGGSGGSGGSGVGNRSSGGPGLRSLAMVLMPSQGPCQAAGSAGGRVLEKEKSGPGPGAPYLGLYVCFSTRLPRQLLQAVWASCQEVVDQVLSGPVLSSLNGGLAAECEVFKCAVPGSYAVLRGLELPEDASMAPAVPARRVNSYNPGGERQGAGPLAVSMFARHTSVAPTQSTDPVLAVAHLSRRPLSGILSGALWTAGDLVQLPPLVPPPQQHATTSCRVVGSPAIESFLSTRGCPELAPSDEPKTFTAPSGGMDRTITRQAVAPCTSSPSIQHTSSRVRWMLQEQAAAGLAAATVAAADAHANSTSIHSSSIDATAADDLLSSLLTTTLLQGGDSQAVPGVPGTLSASQPNIRLSRQWQCDSIVRVTGLDPGDAARQQMDLLVSSIQLTNADSTAGRERSTFIDDLAHLQLGEVLGRGGGGVVLRGKSGTTDVVVKLMEMPIAPEPDVREVEDDGQSGQSCMGGDNEDGGSKGVRAANSAKRLRARRTMLRQAMELWCGNVLSHPNIVQVYTTFNSVVLKFRKAQDGSRQFYLLPVPEHPATNPAASISIGVKDKEAMEPGDSICTAMLVEWCDKGSLADALHSKAFPKAATRHADDDVWALTYDMKSVYLTLLDVALALRHLHSHCLVHRDLKPANLLLKSCPRDYRGFTVKLADFGFVLQLSEMDADGIRYVDVDQTCGTVTHMCPEALCKQPRLDASADVFAFGIIMWELLAGGLRPYPQVPVERIPRLVARGGRPTFRDNVPQSYRRLAVACWSTSPAKRPRAADLVAAISAELAVVI